MRVLVNTVLLPGGGSCRAWRRRGIVPVPNPHQLFTPSAIDTGGGTYMRPPRADEKDMENRRFLALSVLPFLPRCFFLPCLSLLSCLSCFFYVLMSCALSCGFCVVLSVLLFLWSYVLRCVLRFFLVCLFFFLVLWNFLLIQRINFNFNIWLNAWILWNYWFFQFYRIFHWFFQIYRIFLNNWIWLNWILI